MTLLSAPDVARFLGVSLRTWTTEHCTTLMEPLAITASQPDGKCRRQPTSSNGRLAAPVRGGLKGGHRG